MKRARTLILIFLSLIAILCILTVQSVYRERKQERLNYDLIAAVKRNDTKKVVSLLKQGADANCHDEPYKPGPWWTMLRDRLTGKHPNPSTTDTPLLLALKWKDKNDANGDVVFPPENPPLATALIDHKANVNFRDKRRFNALVFAIMDKKKATIHLLLKHGADMKPDSVSGIAPLVFAAGFFSDSTDIIADMLHRGADVNQRDRIGDTALFEAVMIGNVEAVRLLLSYHADVTIRGWKGLTPLALTKGGSIIPEVQQIIDLLKQAGAKQ